MLILSRKVNESIVIDDNIVITVVEVNRGKVRIGIEAPSKIPVHRKEVLEEIKLGERDGKGKKLSKL